MIINGKLTYVQYNSNDYSIPKLIKPVLPSNIISRNFYCIVLHSEDLLPYEVLIFSVYCLGFLKQLCELSFELQVFVVCWT